MQIRVLMSTLAIAFAATSALAQRADFYGLGGSARIRGLSDDGRVAAGHLVQGGYTRGAIWERDVGWRYIDPPNGYMNLQLSDVSGDGMIFSGTSTHVSDRIFFLASRYTAATGVVTLTDINSNPPGPWERDASSGDLMSRDGRVIAGVGRDSYDAYAMTWTHNGPTRVATVPSTFSTAVNADGRFVGGTNLSVFAPFLWDTVTGEFEHIGPGNFSAATVGALSADGSIAVGGSQGWRWDRALGFRYLPRHADGSVPVGATCLSADNSIIAGGGSAEGAGQRSVVFVWTEQRGTVYLTTLLDEAGVSHDGWVLLSLTGMSADGRHFVGEGRNPEGERESWYAFLPDLAPPLCSAALPCPADFDHSGGVDGDDITAFISSWQQGEDCGDIDRSGGVDGEDIGAFIGRWQAGC